MGIKGRLHGDIPALNGFEMGKHSSTSHGMPWDAMGFKVAVSQKSGTLGYYHSKIAFMDSMDVQSSAIFFGVGL